MNSSWVGVSFADFAQQFLSNSFLLADKTCMKFPLEKLNYYFDEIKKDDFDKGHILQRSAVCSRIKSKLLLLPESQFSAIIATIEGVIDNNLKQKIEAQDSKEKKDKQRKEDAASLRQSLENIL